MERPGAVPLRTLPYSHVSETYDSGSAFGSSSVMPRACSQLATTSHEKFFFMIGVAFNVISVPSFLVTAPFRLNRM